MLKSIFDGKTGRKNEPEYVIASFSLLNCKPRFRFARVSSSLAEFAKESAEKRGLKADVSNTNLAVKFASPEISLAKRLKYQCSAC